MSIVWTSSVSCGQTRTRLGVLVAMAGLACGGVVFGDTGTFTKEGAKSPATEASAAENAAQNAAAAAAQLGDPLAEADPMDPTAPRSNEPAPEGATIIPPTAPEPAGPASDGSAKVNVSEYMTVDLFVQDEDLATVLQMLSVQSQRNIVASRDVVATVSANLYGVTFYEALDAILHVNGYGYIEKGNFIYVYPADVIAQIEARERRMVSRVIQLNYLNANDAAEFVSPLLSKDGQIKTNGDAGEFDLPVGTPKGNEEFALASTLVLYDFPENVEEIATLLGQLDTRPSQVLVEATILQSTLNEANSFGVNFAIISDVNFTDFLGIGGPLRVAQALSGADGDNAFAPADNQGFGLNSNPTDFSKPATLKLGLIQDDFSIFLRALDEVSDTTVVSNPKILTLNRQPARVQVGRRLGYLSTTTTDTSTTQSVEFLDTGTVLNFRPFISNDGMIRMELAPSVSEGFIRDQSDSTGAQVTVPDEVTQLITTNVMVPDGATVVLGGLFRESTSLGRSQVPVLGDIPVLGAAFRGHDDKIDRAEIIFMIKPTIMRDSVLAEQGDRAMQYVGHVRTGTRQGLLPFSRERQTAQLNVEAEQLAAEGKWDEAMWSLRRSLELNPNQPDAIELRERLFNSNSSWPSRSVLKNMIQGEVENSIDEKWWPLRILEAPKAEPQHEAAEAAPASAAEPTPVSQMPAWLEERAAEIEPTVEPESYTYEAPASMSGADESGLFRAYPAADAGSEPQPLQQQAAGQGFLVNAPQNSGPLQEDQGFAARLNRLLAIMGVPPAYSFEPGLESSALGQEMATVPTENTPEQE